MKQSTAGRHARSVAVVFRHNQLPPEFWPSPRLPQSPGAAQQSLSNKKGKTNERTRKMLGGSSGARGFFFLRAVFLFWPLFTSSESSFTSLFYWMRIDTSSPIKVFTSPVSSSRTTRQPSLESSTTVAASGSGFSRFLGITQIF